MTVARVQQQKQVAEALIEIGAVGFALKKPITFKSGIVSPVYVDNRKFPFHPKQWQVVIDGFKQVISDEEIAFTVLAGIATAGIPHSAALAYSLGVPSVFVRKESKDHGTKKMIEGGEVAGENVLLLEDLVTTGGSSLAGVAALRAERAVVSDCLVIISYGFQEAVDLFAAANVQLHPLTTFEVVFDVAREKNLLTVQEKAVVSDWLTDPWGWAGRHSISKTE